MENLNKEIPLTQGKVALVSESDFNYLNQWTWFAKQVRHGKAEIFYAARNITAEDKKQTTLLMHRFILGITDPNIKLDHINRDGLNNTRENLRIGSQAQNARNKTSAVGASSEFLGVDIHKSTGRWRSRLMHKGKSIYLGLFDSENDAAKAYDDAAIIHGDFANLNFK